MCSSTYMAFSQNTSHPVGRSPLWLFPRTFLNFCHFEGVRKALGQTWFAHMQEPFTRIPNLVLTQKSHLAPYFTVSQNTAALMIFYPIFFQIMGFYSCTMEEVKSSSGHTWAGSELGYISRPQMQAEWKRNECDLPTLLMSRTSQM